MAARAASLAVSADSGARPLEGAEKVAALLLAMGKPAAGRLLKHFDQDELKSITRAAADLGQVAPFEIETLIESFADEFSAGVSLNGTAQEVEKLLTGLLPPEQVSDIMSVVMGAPAAAESPWEKLADIPDPQLLDMLAREHPQVSAYILSRLDPPVAARLIGKLPSSLRNAFMRRLSAMNTVTPAAQRVLDEALNQALAGSLVKTAGPDPNTRLADILNRLDPEQIDGVLGSLAESRPETAKALEALLFRFDDVVRLTPKSLVTLFDGVPAERVVLALKGVDMEFRELVLSAIASRARRMVEHELDNGEEPNPRAVADARRLIAERALGMIGRSEIEFNPSENA